MILLIDPNEADTTALYFNPQMRWKFVRDSGQSITDRCEHLLLRGNRVWLNAGAIALAPDQLKQRLDGDGIVIADPRHSTRFAEVLVQPGARITSD